MKLSLSSLRPLRRRHAWGTLALGIAAGLLASAACRGPRAGAIHNHERTAAHSLERALDRVHATDEERERIAPFATKLGASLAGLASERETWLAGMEALLAEEPLDAAGLESFRKRSAERAAALTDEILGSLACALQQLAPERRKELLQLLERS